MPEWEAASKEVHALYEHFSDRYDTRLVAMNFRRRQLALRGREKHIPLPWGLVVLPGLLAQARSRHINHLFVSPGERLTIPVLAGPRTLVTITKVSSPKQIAKNIPHLRRAHKIIVESEYDKALLVDAGLDEDHVEIVYPGVALESYRPAAKPFKILFASSPTRSHEMASRGINLMLQVAKEMPDVHFLFAWRTMIYEELKALLISEGVTNVEVRNGQIDDMRELYQTAHATILPGLEYHSFKPCPRSAVESLAHGKPLLMSRPTSLSRIVEERSCGTVFDPTEESLKSAIRELMNDYDRFQPNCHEAAKSIFSEQYFFERYRQLYEEIA